MASGDGLVGTLTAAGRELGGGAARLAEVIAEAYPAALPVSVVRLLGQAEAGPLDLERLLAAAGIGGYDEVRQAAAYARNQELTSPDARFAARLQRRSSGAALLAGLVERERENLDRSLATLQANGALELAAQRIVAARRRYVVGTSKSLAYATLLAADLSAGMAGVTLVDGSAVRPLDVLSDVRTTDVLIAFSFRRYTRQTIALAREFKAGGGVVIGITDVADGSVARLSDVPVVVETDSASYADSPTAVAAVAHVLATLAVASAKGARRRLARRDELARELDIYEGGS